MVSLASIFVPLRFLVAIDLFEGSFTKRRRTAALQDAVATVEGPLWDGRRKSQIANRNSKFAHGVRFWFSSVIRSLALACSLAASPPSDHVGRNSMNFSVCGGRGGPELVSVISQTKVT